MQGDFQSLLSAFKIFILTVVLFAGVLIFAQLFSKNTVEYFIDINDIQPGKGHSLFARINIDAKKKSYVRGDSGSHPERSTLKVYVNGIPLPLPHAEEHDIEQSGQGRYRHNKKHQLYFSLPAGLSSLHEVEELRVSANLLLPGYIIQGAGFLLSISALVLLYTFFKYRQPGLSVSVFCLRGLQIFLAISVAAYLYYAFTVLPGLISIMPDTFGYVHPLLSWINHGVLDLSAGRSFGYPFLLTIFTLAGSLNHIAIIQFLLFLVTVLMFYLSVLYSMRRLHGKIPAAITASFAALLLLSYFVYIKFSLMLIPEISYQLFQALAIFFMVLALVCRLTCKTLVMYCGAAIFCAGFAFYIKPHAAGMLLLAWLLASALIVGSTLAVSIKVTLLVSMVGGSLLLFGYTYDYFNQRYSAMKTFSAKTLFCNHIDIIDSVLDERLADQALINAIREDFSATKQHAPEDWSQIGYNGDHCLYLIRTPDRITDQLNFDPHQQAHFLNRLFIAGVLKQPMRYLKKISQQYRYAISKPYPNRNQVKGKTETQALFAELVGLDSYKKSDLQASYTQRDFSHPLKAGAIDFSFPGRLILNILHLSAALLFVLFVIMLAVDTWFMFSNKADMADLLKQWTFPALAFLIYMASLSVVAAAHTFDIGRYRHICSVPALYFQLCVFNLILYKLSRSGLAAAFNCYRNR